MVPTVLLEDITRNNYEPVMYIKDVSGSRICSCCSEIPCNYSYGGAQVEFHTGIKTFSLFFGVGAIWSGFVSISGHQHEERVVLDSSALGCFLCTLTQVSIAMVYLLYVLKKDLLVTRVERRETQQYFVDLEGQGNDFKRRIIALHDLLEIYRVMAFCLMGCELLLFLFGVSFSNWPVTLSLILQICNVVVMSLWGMHSVIWMKHYDAFYREFLLGFRLDLKLEVMLMSIVCFSLVGLSYVSAVILVV